jgi:predicted acyltransferase
MKDTSAPSDRLLSLDILRGFDMLWIIGFGNLLQAVLKQVNQGIAPEQGISAWVYRQLGHVGWEGFQFLDLIFPLFVFMSGASLVFSLEKTRSLHGPGKALRKLWQRMFVLFLLGIFSYGGISKGVEGIRWLGVLQRIAIAGGLAGMAYLFLKPKALVWLTAGILLVYWAALCFIPVPGYGAGQLQPETNLVAWFDGQFLPGFKYNGKWDPEGILSTIPAVASALLGMLAALWLRGAAAPVAKARELMLAGLGLVLVGWLWHLQFPIIKKLWTSSFVLVAGGYSSLLLGLFYYVIDVRHWKAWIAPFQWIGMNSIALYLAHQIINFTAIVPKLAGGPLAAAFGSWEKIWLSSVDFALTLAFAWWLHQRKIFLRV